MTDDITKIPVSADADVDDDEAEVAAMGAVAKALKPLLPATRLRVIAWAAAKYDASLPAASPAGTGGTKARATSEPAKAGGTASKGGGRRKAGALSLDKTLDLRPKGGQSFADFVETKKPQNTYEQNVVTVYWLSRVAGLDGVTADHVYTCYKDRTWRVPSDLRNNLQVTASTRGWLDTASMESIKVTIGGENYVEHDLPAKPKSKA